MEKIVVKIRQDDPERNKFKTIYVTRLLKKYHGTDCIKFNNSLFAVSCYGNNTFYHLLYCIK